MSNINRDYLCILDVKTGAINAPKMYFYNTDRSTSNIYVQLVVKETIVNATPIENAIDFVIEAKIVKPNGFVKEMTGQLVNKADAIYEFDLPEDFTDLTGINQVEFWVRAKVSNREERITSASTKYTVKGSILNSIDDDIEDDNDYPIFLALMERVERLDKEVTEVSLATKALNEESKGELAKIKADEVEIANNEAIRQAQEAAREYSEDTRGANESRRIQAEAAREQAEETRQEQEGLREDNEITRQSNEASREAAEQTRQTNENTRIANENARREAETARAGAEATRVTAENNRKTQEILRQEAEADRVVAEQAREASNTAMRQDITNMQNEINNFKSDVNNDIEEIRTTTGQEIDTMKVIVENQNAKIDYIKENDRKQDILINGIFNSQDNKLTSTKEGNVHDLVESKPGLLYVDNITGNTMVNCNKEADKSIVLAGAINETGVNNITLTQGVDGAKADVYVEGNTMVNVCDQEEAVAITKSYTVETGNHVALQGEFDGKCRPVVYGNTLVNLTTTDSITINTKTVSYYIALLHDLPVGTYTAIFNLSTNTLDGKVKLACKLDNETYYPGGIDVGKTGLIKYIFTPTSTINSIRFYTDTSTSGEAIIENLMILEGDYTNKPIPDYFTGMQSSFEDKVVTQEMVDSGKELAENLGKYKVEYKVTGKNKINVSKTGKLVTIGSGGAQRYGFEFNKKGTFALSLTNANNYNLAYKVKSGSNYSSYTAFTNNLTFTLNKDETLIVYVGNENTTLSDFGISNIQIEEGSTATAYEPYKESTKTYYLNSPLLEGDTIEESSGNVVHVHRYETMLIDGSGKWTHNTIWSNDDYLLFYDTTKPKYQNSTVMSDKLPSYSDIIQNSTPVKEGFRNEVNNLQISIASSKLSTKDLEGFISYLQTNPLTVVYQLASPTYEVISQNDSILQDSYSGGSLDVDTAVPIDKVEFKNWSKHLKYIYPDKNYILQFESDNIGKLYYSWCNGNINARDIIKGINKIEFTTGSTSDTNMQISGIGFNMSNLVVTEATEGDFGYFKGMKSVGEQEGNKIEILSQNKNLWDINDFGIASGIYSGVEITRLDNGFKFNGVSTGSYTRHCLINYLDKFELGKTYTLTGDYFTFECTFANGRKKYGNNVTVTKDLVKVSCYIQWQGSSIVFDNLIITPQIEEGAVATTYVKSTYNKKQILCDPLRKVGDIADRYVLVDGKWYIERNIRQKLLTGADSEEWVVHNYVDENVTEFRYNTGNPVIVGNPNSTISDKLIGKAEGKIDRIAWAGDVVYITISINKLPTNDVAGLRQWLSNNNILVQNQLASPVYEPINYNPLDIYSDTTHISINSNIPAKLKARNHGYNCMLKPNTTYTATYNIDGTPQKTTIVTPATLDDATRFTGTGTLDNFLLLEGDISNPPAFFSGMRSCFDQEYDEVKGKWKVNIRVEGNGTYNDITIYINEPLREGDIIRAENRKILVERHWGEAVLNGNWNDDGIGNYGRKIATSNIRLPKKCSIDTYTNASFISPKFLMSTEPSAYNIVLNGIRLRYANNTYYFNCVIPKSVTDINKYMEDLEIVYQLAEPIIEEVETDYTRLMLESYENATVYFNSHIFPTSTIRYQANVISTAEVMSVNDEQDMLLIDSATEIAVIKLTM